MPFPLSFSLAYLKSISRISVHLCVARSLNCTPFAQHIPPGFLLPHWPLYFETFSTYLAHPASTVRLASSEVFRYLGGCMCVRAFPGLTLLHSALLDW